MKEQPPYSTGANTSDKYCCACRQWVNSLNGDYINGKWVCPECLKRFARIITEQGDTQK
jgi:hypothetical protein